jgi:hypothetical protein
MPSAASSRVLFSCVAENDAHWFRIAQNLVLSVRRTGGALAEAPFVVNVVGAVDPMWHALRDWDVELRVVQRVMPERATFNKLRMFELAAEHDFDTLVVSDCDIVILGDISRYTSPAALGVVPAIRHRHSAEDWERVYADFGIAVPAARVVSTVSGELGHPYYNGGFLIARREMCEPVRDRWFTLGKEVFRRCEADSGYLGKPPGDQISLALTIADLGITVDQMPLNMNMSSRAPHFAPHYADDWGPPFVLHYHDHIGPDGFLLGSPQRRVSEQCDTFNRLRAEALGIRYRRINPKETKVAAFRRRAARRLRRLIGRSSQ